MNNNKCDKHTIYMVKGKSQTKLASINLGMPTFINIHCKECKTYIKHASHAELNAWESLTEEEQHRVTYLNLHKMVYQQVPVYDENNPEEYLNSFSKDTLWLNLPFTEKEKAKKLKAGVRWEPFVKAWYTSIFNKNAIKLMKWVFPADIQRLQDAQNQSKEDRQGSLRQSFRKRPDYEEVYPQSYWDKAYDKHMNNKTITGE